MITARGKAYPHDSRVELIGEEIYDEFDQEGAGGTYVPIEHPPISKLHGESLPDLPSTVTQLAEAPKYAPTGSVLRPLSAKGFGFLRSLSEPPIPREKKQVSIVQPVPKTSALSPIGDDINEQDKPKTILQTLEVMTIEDPQDTLQPAKTSSEGALPAHSPNKTVSSAGIASSVPLSASAPGTRPSSPAPSLEAILLDRKRRLAAAKESGTSLAPVPTPSDMRSPAMLRVPTVSTKVGKFKSSPLTGGERGRIFVAEEVPNMTGAPYGERIPDKKEDDAAHVKKEDDSGYL